MGLLPDGESIGNISSFFRSMKYAGNHLGNWNYIVTDHYTILKRKVSIIRIMMIEQGKWIRSII